MRRYTGDDGPESELPSGDVTEGVVRAGGTVRRPPQPQSPAVAAYLDHLERAGFDGAPRFLGRDAQGRDVLTFLDGEPAGSPPEPWAADDALLASLGPLLRRLHDASEGFLSGTGFAAPDGGVWRRDQVPVAVPVPDPDPEPELVCHLDVTPQNVVVREGKAAGLIDFDLAGPGTRLLEVYNTAMHWVPLCAPEDVYPDWPAADRPARLRLLADAYGLGEAERRALPDLGVDRCDSGRARMKASAELLGGGWARMWEEGVGDVILRRRAWLTENREVLLDALLG
ncbi:phosphotransferase [Nocardiopsis sp. CNT-189]|uniref:phosphotransferase n=1 Tax=Nocardiopsis oceanisediminis TaxID=2816862 RepID=UPI003B2A3AF0